MISVLMSVYNEEVGYVEQSVSSILNQSYSDFELIIVIDNPKNEAVIEYLIRQANKDSRIKLIYNDQNIGLAKSLNKGFEHSTGEFIARMDADDISKSHRFQTEIDYLINHEAVMLVSSTAEIIDEDGNSLHNLNTKGYDSKKLSRILKVTNVLIHPSWMMRRELFIQLKGYRNIFAEDYDFVLRANDNDYPMDQLD
jgi:glycosyltransferase involved in cell wall biosynthesis